MCFTIHERELHCEWDVFVDILTSLGAVGFHIIEQGVLSGYTGMVLNMVEHLTSLEFFTLVVIKSNRRSPIIHTGRPIQIIINLLYPTITLTKLRFQLKEPEPS